MSIFITAIIIINISTPVMGSGLLASPTMFQYKFTDSNTGSGQLFVENIGDDEVDVTVNKKRLLKDNIHLDFLDNGIANWITITSPTNFTLKPGESKMVSFKITAPNKFDYNDAVGALVIKGVPKPLNKSNSDVPKVTIQQAVELVIPIVVGLPGPIIESLQLLEHSSPTMLISFMPGDFIYHVKNNGTVYANMTGNIEINGLLTDHKALIQGGVFPEDQYYANTTWEPGFSDFGLYSADTTIKYGRYNQTQTIKTHDTILVIPIWLIILIVLAAVIWYIRKKDIEPPIKIKIERK